MEELRESHGATRPVVISGCVGPHDDGYNPAELLTPTRRASYHSTPDRAFAETAADMVTAITMTYVDEAIGIARAAKAAGMPVAISFTVETDGRLPERSGARRGGRGGRRPRPARRRLLHDQLRSPDPLRGRARRRGAVDGRIRGFRANASTMSHAELDEATELDTAIRRPRRPLRGAAEQLPQLNVLGGCCGTDHRHVAEIAAVWPGGRCV